MTNLLNWNIGNNKNRLIDKVLLEMIEEHVIDIIILQEAYGTSIKNLLTPRFEEISYPSGGVGSGVRLFLKTDEFQHFSVRRTANKKLVFAHLKNKISNEEFNVAAVHLHSKVGNTARQQLWKNLLLIKDLYDFEKTSTNSNTVLVGDFNQNPFEHDLVDPNMINGIESRELIATLTKYPVSKKNLNFWYNPMWNFKGDYDFRNDDKRIIGSYFMYGEDERPIWNLLDGFMVRPSLMHKIDFNLCSIITGTKTENFLKPFIIRKDEPIIKEDLSDHLPIKFALTNK